MLKAKIENKDGEDLFVFGLSKLNLKNLKNGHAIKIDHPDFPKIYIFYGENELKMRKMIGPLIGPDTVQLKD